MKNPKGLYYNVYGLYVYIYRNYPQFTANSFTSPFGFLSLVLLNPDMPCLWNSVDPDQLASEEANWSGSALFVIKDMNLYQQPRSSNVIGWKLKVSVASWFIQHDKG